MKERCEFCKGRGGRVGAGSIYHVCNYCDGTGFGEGKRPMPSDEYAQIRADLYEELYTKIYKEVYDKLFKEFSEKMKNDNIESISSSKPESTISEPRKRRGRPRRI